MTAWVSIVSLGTPRPQAEPGWDREKNHLNHVVQQNMLVPIAAAPLYLPLALTPAAVVSMVEKVWAIATSARPRIAPSNIPTRCWKLRRELVT